MRKIEFGELIPYRLDLSSRLCHNTYINEEGDIAQLGERLNGIQEVDGSSPFISNPKLYPSGKGFGFCVLRRE